MKEVTYRRQAEKKLRRMPRNERQKVIEKINLYASEPETLANNVISMTDSPYYRLRIGDWRVVFDENDTVIDIIKIKSRGEIYKK